MVGPLEPWTVAVIGGVEVNGLGGMVGGTDGRSRGWRWPAGAWSLVELGQRRPAEPSTVAVNWSIELKGL